MLMRAALLSALLFASPSYAATEDEGKQQQAQRNEENAEHPSAISELGEPSAGGVGGTNEKEQRGPGSRLLHWVCNGDHWMVLGTWVLAIAAIGQFELTRQNWRRQLRAYVSMLDPAIGGVAANSKPVVRIRFRNDGETPAYDVRHIHVVTTGVAAVAPKLIDVPRDTDNVSIGDLGKGVGGETVAYAAAPLTDDDMRRILDGREAIYAYGRITYRDVFGRDWETTYRFKHPLNVSQVGNGEMSPCKSNDAD